MSHGTTIGYNRGCRCTECREAIAAYQRRRTGARKRSQWGCRPAPVIDREGYRYVWIPDTHPMAAMRTRSCNRPGFVREHRLIMALMLGRPLTQSEHVHHRNEHKLDNRPANLYLFASAAEHQQYHRRQRSAA